MKKGRLLALFGLGALLAAPSAAIECEHEAITPHEAIVMRADGNEAASSESASSSEPTETYECKVVVSAAEHGEVVVDKEEGHIGDIVTVNAVHDMFFVVDNVSVNGTALVESEDISGQYTFALAEGDNVITAKFVIDEELLGEMSVIFEQAANKDWKNLFSVENVLRIVSFLLNGGVLVAIARYFIKDKRLEKKVEKKIEEVVQKVIPDSTKETVLANTEKFIVPYFSKIEGEMENVENALTVFSRCLALAQENTPESKIAITQELSSLSLSDKVAVSEVQKRLEQFIDEQKKEMADMIAKLNTMQETNSAIASGTDVSQSGETVEAEAETADKTEDDGTQF